MNYFWYEPAKADALQGHRKVGKSGRARHNQGLLNKVINIERVLLCLGPFESVLLILLPMDFLSMSCHILIPRFSIKGQFISKGTIGILNSSKKNQKKTDLTSMIP